MINIDFINGTVEDYTVVLSNRNYEKQGQILNVQDFDYKGNLNSANEISFSVYKEIDGKEETLWNDIYDLRLVWIKETDEFFQIAISKTESTNTVKKITGTSLCEAELSQTTIRNTEINSEADIARDDYVVTKFYNPENKDGSLLHRILSFAPHYSIKHVDRSLWDIQRTFSIDGKDIYGFFTGELAEQIGCLFQFDSTDRSISVYDLYTVCNDCGYRGEYLDSCPKCNSENLYYYGEDTTIFVSAGNLTDEINFDTDVDAIKNCMLLKTGDEVMDAAVIACNPNASQYIYYFSEEQKNDMPDSLKNKLNDYDDLVESYSEEYQRLSQELYECIDDILYYQSGMMPNVEIPEVNATTEAAKLTVNNLSPVGMSMVTSYTSTATVNSALKNFAKVFVKSGFVKVEIESGTFTYMGIDSKGHGHGKWKGKFKVTNYSDEEDIAYSKELTIKVTDDYETFLNQKVLKNIANNNTDDDSVFDVLGIEDLNKFKQALTLYSYNRLESFADAIQGVINVLIEENQGQSDSTYYGQLYTPYYNKLQACQAEMNIRATTIDNLENTQTSIIKRQSEIQSDLNLEYFLGEELYKLFCAYRREDTYQNDNFISDGLSNEEIFEKVKEFIELAKNEIVKSGEHQHSMSSNLYNLLIMDEFAPIKDKFDLGNWIRVGIDDEVYRLRLISYEINGKSLSNINTEFSELTKTACGVNDVRSILDKAQSMAMSYSYVAKQAEQGKKAKDAILNVEKEGINSAHMNIMNSPEQETVFGKYGLLCRTKDETGEYSPEQSRITNNIWAFTNDNWKSVTLGLGKHDYYYYDDNDVLQKETGYGLSSKFVSSGYVWGSQIIGGEIYSENYSPVSNSDFGSGTYLDLNKGSFSMAGGRLVYDGEDELLIKGVNITWEDIEGSEAAVTEITKKVVTQEYVNSLEVIAGSVDAENITGETISGKYFSGGHININDKYSNKYSYGEYAVWFSKTATSSSHMNNIYCTGVIYYYVPSIKNTPDAPILSDAVSEIVNVFENNSVEEQHTSDATDISTDLSLCTYYVNFDLFSIGQITNHVYECYRLDVEVQEENNSGFNNIYTETSINLGRKVDTEIGNQSVAIGIDNTVVGVNSIAIGQNNIINETKFEHAQDYARDSMIVGDSNTIDCTYPAVVFGNNNKLLSPTYSFDNTGGTIVAGNGNTVNSNAHHAIFGRNNTVNARNNSGSGSYGCFTSGLGNTVYGYYATAIGWNNEAGCDNEASIAIGRGNKSTGMSSIAMGSYCEATNSYSFAGGTDSKSSGLGSFSFGYYCEATNYCSVALGGWSKANGYQSFAAGYQAEVGSNGYTGIAMGYQAKTEGSEGVAIGSYNEAKGGQSLALGCHSSTSAYNTIAMGYYAKASSSHQTAMGKFNIEDTEGKYALIFGGGEYDKPKNIFTLDWDGSARFGGYIIDKNGYDVGGIDTTTDSNISTPIDGNVIINISAKYEQDNLKGFSLYKFEDKAGTYNGVIVTVENNLLSWSGNPTVATGALMYDIYFNEIDLSLIEEGNYIYGKNIYFDVYDIEGSLLQENTWRYQYSSSVVGKVIPRIRRENWYFSPGSTLIMITQSPDYYDYSGDFDKCITLEPYVGRIPSPSPNYSQSITFSSLSSIALENESGNTIIDFGEDVTLYSTGNINDSIIATSIERKVATVTLTGNETINGDAIAGYFTYSPAIAAKVGSINVLSDHYRNINGDTSETDYNIFIDENGNIRIQHSGFSSIDEYKTWLTSNNVIIAYERAETEIIALSDDVSTSLKNLKIYSGETTVSTTSSTIQSTIEIEYPTSKMGKYVLELLSIMKNIKNAEGGAY